MKMETVKVIVALNGSIGAENVFGLLGIGDRMTKAAIGSIFIMLMVLLETNVETTYVDQEVQTEEQPMDNLPICLFPESSTYHNHIKCHHTQRSKPWVTRRDLSVLCTSTCNSYRETPGTNRPCGRLMLILAVHLTNSY